MISLKVAYIAVKKYVQLIMNKTYLTYLTTVRVGYTNMHVNVTEKGFSHTCC